ncbi:MAG TPA: hypothetical protein VLI68_14240 [Hanamia sp.]|jgi:hypothetical protein|nr:hypothetical protein [Hanamia sp.]
MRYTILFSIFLFAILTGCNKDKFGSKPTLKFKSVNTTVLTNGQQLQMTLSFTDGSGSLAGSMFVERYVANCPASTLSEMDSIPKFPSSKNQKGDLVISYDYVNIEPQCQQNDTAVFRFAISNKDNHTSDTVSSPPIIILYQ